MQNSGNWVSFRPLETKRPNLFMVHIKPSNFKIPLLCQSIDSYINAMYFSETFFKGIHQKKTQKKTDGQ